MDSEQPPGGGGRNLIIGALTGGAAGLLPGFLLWTMTGQWAWLAIGPVVLAIFGAVAALLLRPF